MVEAAVVYWAIKVFRKARAAAGTGSGGARAGSVLAADPGPRVPGQFVLPKCLPRLRDVIASVPQVYKTASYLVIRKGKFLSLDYPGIAMYKKKRNYQGNLFFVHPQFLGWVLIYPLKVCEFLIYDTIMFCVSYFPPPPPSKKKKLLTLRIFFTLMENYLNVNI